MYASVPHDIRCLCASYPCCRLYPTLFNNKKILRVLVIKKNIKKMYANAYQLYYDSFIALELK